MSKRRDPERLIVEFFMASPPDVAATLLRVVKGIVEARGIASTPPARPVPARRKRPALDLRTAGDVTPQQGPAPSRVGG
jgi:anti-sigma factor RsiW